MKETIRQPNILQQTAGRVQKRVLENPSLRTGVRLGAYLLGGFVLSGAGLLRSPLPFAVCLVCILPIGLPSLAALLGAIAGYFAFWGLYDGLEGAAAAILVFSCVRIFAPTPYCGRLWFAPAACAAMTAVIGGVFFLAGTIHAQQAALLAAKILLAAVGAAGFRRALMDFDRWAQIFFGACVLMGLCAVPLPFGMTLGAVAASTASVCASGTALGAVTAGICGLALDLSLGTGGAVTAAFLLGGILCLALPTPNGPYRAALFTVSVTAGLLFSGGPLAAPIASTALGAALSIPLPTALFHRRPSAAEQTACVRSQLGEAASALDRLSRFLQQTSAVPQQSDAAVIFDRTADEICQCCGGYDRCWQQNAAQTYHILSEAAPQILTRGMALRSDFPPEFRCCRLDSFVRAVNCELDELRLRKLWQSRADQAVRCAQEQYTLLAALLRTSAQTLSGRSARPDRFRCEVAASAARRDGAAVSGDRCASVRGPDHRFYIMLCDGMGTGPAAAEESQHAASVLCGLLRAGASAEQAITAFDLACSLRADGGFATIDLLEVDLLGGEMTLYKQGAAPSYYRKGRRVGQVGTATAPPGYTTGGDRRIGRYCLSLGEEDLLVLVSDGAGGPPTAQQLAAWDGTAPAELADRLIAECTGEDDATAVVIRLQPRTCT